jgi:hypothetical protein
VRSLGFNIISIVYDTFAVEGYFMGKELGIPAFCSIPAFYQKVPQQVVEHMRDFCHPLPKGFLETEINMVSDGPMIKGDLSLVWSAPLPVQEPLESKMFRVGYPLSFKTMRHPKEPKLAEAPGAQEQIYMSFGTVVMNHLWDRNPTVSKMVTRIVEALLPLAPDYTIVFSTQGKFKVSGMICRDSFNQPIMLGESSLFITHGGNNSFQEALKAKIPMLVIPFFGDQHAVAQAVEDNKLGEVIPLLRHDRLSTEGNKLRSVDPVKFRAQVLNMMNRPKQPRIPSALDLTPLFENKIRFDEGDLLFGCAEDRKLYVRMVDGDSEFLMHRYKPWSDITDGKISLPRILDIYHDGLVEDRFYQVEIDPWIAPTTKRYRSHVGHSR